MNEYEAKREARIDRLRDRAEKTRAEASRTLDSARGMADCIPFGQPILVGHHSEKRDRNFRGRIDSKFRKSFELEKQAKELASRAAAAESNTAISSDDPEAVVKLREKIEAAEAVQERMKATNKIIQGKPKNVSTPEKIAELLKLNICEDRAALLFEPDFIGRIGFASYQLTNNNANIRRMKQRLEELSKHDNRENKTHEYEGFEVVENADENRVQFIFPGKPDANIRTLLKRRGFRWAPSQGAWQRNLNGNGIFNARELIAELTR